MDPNRQAEVCRALVKMMFREKGLRFDKDSMREIGNKVKEFNEQTKLSPPITVEEYCELYLELARELVGEHFAVVESRLMEAQFPPPSETGAEGRRKIVPGGVPGGAFRDAQNP